MTIVSASREEILGHVRDAMRELFQLDAEKIQLDTKIVDDLDLDSIDAIELAVRMEALTGQRFDPESVREIRTIGDIVEILHRRLNGAPVPAIS
jgi:acyl carrier protein